MKTWKIELDRTWVAEVVTVKADYMEVGHTLVFKNRGDNTVVAAFQNWLSVKENEDN